MSSIPTSYLTLAQSFIEQGLIHNPQFIEAARQQTALLQNGSYRLLGSILADLPPDKATFALENLIESVPEGPGPDQLETLNPADLLELPEQLDLSELLGLEQRMGAGTSELR